MNVFTRDWLFVILVFRRALVCSICRTIVAVAAGRANVLRRTDTLASYMAGAYLNNGLANSDAFIRSA